MFMMRSLVVTGLAFDSSESRAVVDESGLAVV
jgi:hypothetical protein